MKQKSKSLGTRACVDFSFDTSVSSRVAKNIVKTYKFNCHESHCIDQLHVTRMMSVYVHVTRVTSVYIHVTRVT